MIVATLLVVGSTFMLLAGIGLVRLPDLFLRMSATSKAATLGAALTTLGAGLYFEDAAVLFRTIVIVGFLVVTAPVAAHMIGRAGYRRGAPLDDATICDEAEGYLPRDGVQETD